VDEGKLSELSEHNYRTMDSKGSGEGSEGGRGEDGRLKMN
jgi:hypothetical protein